jgi:pimeloyl-ACP methyl ester carboxylesterase
MAPGGPIARGRYQLLEDSGHGIPWEHPEAVIAAVDSLVRELR